MSLVDLLEPILPDDGSADAYRELVVHHLRRRERQGAFGVTLAAHCCAAAGGVVDQARPVDAAWHILREAAAILDDVADGDLDPAAWPAAGHGAPLNVATGLIAAAGLLSRALQSGGVATETIMAVRQAFDTAMWRMCRGQHHDLTVAEPDLAIAWDTAAAKSGVCLGAACWAGARLATPDTAVLAVFERFGHSLGLLIQIRDDLADLWPQDGQTSDLARGARSLPVAYTLSVLPPDAQADFRATLAAARDDPAAAARARRRIVESAAALYMTVKAGGYRQLGAAALGELAAAGLKIAPLQARLDEVALPVTA